MYNVVANLREIQSCSITSIDKIVSDCPEPFEFRDIENIVFGQDSDNKNTLFSKGQSIHTFDCRAIKGYYNNFCFEGILSEPLFILQDYGFGGFDEGDRFNELIDSQNVNVAISESDVIYLCSFCAGNDNIILCSIAKHEGLFKKYLDGQFHAKRPFDIEKEENKYYLLLSLFDGLLKIEIPF